MSDSTPSDPNCEYCGEDLGDHLGTWQTCPKVGSSGKSFRRKIADMPSVGIAPRVDVPLGRYRHYKGDLYDVIGGALHATSGKDEVLVLYRSVEHGYTATRTLDDFNGTTLFGGVTVNRFERVQ